MKPKELLKKATQLGWQVVSIKGSHYKLKKESNTVTIPMHNKDLKPGTLNGIMKQLELK